MNKFTIILDNQKTTVTAQGWQVGIGGYYIFLDDKNETVAIAPPTALIGNSNNIKQQNYRDWETDRKSTRLNSSHRSLSRMPSSA